MNDRDVVTRGIHTDCLLNYETVKYFNGEHHEGERYRNALAEYQALEYRVIGGSRFRSVCHTLTLPSSFTQFTESCAKPYSRMSNSRLDPFPGLTTLDSWFPRWIDYRGPASHKWRQFR